MSKKQITWSLTDHMCRTCGGRVLQSASGVGATGGGNPLFRCADCGVCTSGMGPNCLCYCGFEHRRASTQTNAYRCVRVDKGKEDKAMRAALLSCGFDCDRPRSEIGVFNPDYYRLAQEKIWKEEEVNG